MTREEAIKLIEHISITFVPTDQYGDYDDPQPYEEALHMAIEALSADRPTGEWITKHNGNGWNDWLDYTCTNCGAKYEQADSVLYHSNFCPNCGADMRGKEHEQKHI